MRIISALTIVRLLILVMLIPNITLAAEDTNTNETKVSLKIQEAGIINNDLILNNKNMALLTYDPNDFKKAFDSEKIIDPGRERVLAKYEKQRQSAKLPTGKFTINVSAYTAAADECGKSDGITASGLMVKENETIACPPQFPIGTRIKISGMGIYICQDRGGAIKGNHIDIYMKTKSQAFSFGRKNLLAEVVR
jgi:3D (Asp-Asp-Asp) domain-containing protein